MALEERKVIDMLEVLRDGTVQVREAIEVLRDGEIIASQYHRFVVSIGDEAPDLSGMDAASRAVVEAARTQERRQAARQRPANDPSAPTEGQGDRVVPGIAPEPLR